MSWHPIPGIDPPNDCDYWWRVMKGACWKMTTDGGKKMIAPCTNINIICCLERFEICLDETGTQRIVKRAPSPVIVSGECDPNQIDCYPVCGSTYGR